MLQLHALQEEPRGSELLCEGGQTILQGPRARLTTRVSSLATSGVKTTTPVATAATLRSRLATTKFAAAIMLVQYLLKHLIIHNYVSKIIMSNFNFVARYSIENPVL